MCFLLWQKQALVEASFLELEMLGIWEASVLALMLSWPSLCWGFLFSILCRDGLVDIV